MYQYELSENAAEPAASRSVPTFVETIDEKLYLYNVLGTNDPLWVVNVAAYSASSVEL